MIGEKVRDFEIQSELGSGGYGVVYRAHDESVDRDVAIKVILPQYANQPEFVENFATEARLVAALEHPRIVPLYSYWQDEQGAFLVMRYVRGGSLRGILAKQGALPLNKVLRLVEQIADALNAAHEAGVVHRDLKPDNILIDERGNAYLTDFGIAKQLSDEDASATDSIKGTFAYLSPEQIQQLPVSPQSDIYALGVMLFEMLAGQHPFYETPIGMMIMKHLQEPLPDIRDLRDDLNGDIVDVIYKATAKDVTERYTSTLELVNDLQTAISGVTVAQPQPIVSVKKKKTTTTEERNRFAMLENVRKFWVEGVLENSLYDAIMIDLGMKSESGAVDNPWDTLIRTPAGDETLTDESILSVFDRLNGKLLILGDPGSGKTTTLLTLARDLLQRAELDEQHPIPVVFNLSSWSEHQPPLTEWLIEELNSKYQVPRKVGQKWVEDDELLLLLDGLDEVAETMRDACVGAINEYRGEHGFVDVVVCSRIKDYEALTAQLKLNGAIVIQPLDDTQIIQYLNALGADVAVVRELITRDAQLRELAKSPLMLSIMVLAYRGKTADDVPDFDDVDAQRQHLFDVYVERMVDRRVRVSDKSYSKGEIKHYLAHLAKIMRRQTQTVFAIEELQPLIIPESQRTNYYRRVQLIHIGITTTLWMIQALLMAIGLKASISMLVAGFMVAGIYTSWIWSGNEWKNPSSGIMIGLINGTAIFGAVIRIDFETAIFAGLLWLVGSIFWLRMNTIIYLSNNGNRDAIPLIEIIRFRLDNINFGQWINIWIGAFSVIGGVVLPLAYVFEMDVLRISLGWFLGTTLTGSLMVAQSSLDMGELSLRHFPNQGMRATFRTTTMIFLLLITFSTIGNMILALFLDIPILNGFLIGAGAGIGMIGYGAWVIFGGIGVYRHWMLRRTLTNLGYLPYNLARFLDHASSLILLRKVGGSYIFIHRYLLEYFAELDVDESMQ